CDLKDVADGAIKVESEIRDYARGGDVARLEIARQMRADINIDRNAGDHADEAPAVGAAACFHDQGDQEDADEKRVERQEGRVERQVLVAQCDVAAQSK